MKLRINTRSIDIRLILNLGIVFLLLLFFSSNTSQSQLFTVKVEPGQSATLLSNGRWLLLGGQSPTGPVNRASIFDPHTGAIIPLSSRLHQARTWHTATMLPDGTVFVFGGIGSNGQVLASGELFNPENQTFALLPDVCCLSARAHHTGTLLTDGRMLIAGGVGVNNQTLASAELWYYEDSSGSKLPDLTLARRSHVATLLEDGKVLIAGGTNARGDSASGGDLFDPSTETFSSLKSAQIGSIIPSSTPFLAGSLPLHDSVNVDTDRIISLRFSKPLRPETVSIETVTLSGPKGIETIKIVVAEGGMLAFITPEADLLPGSTYQVTINGASDKNGLLLPASGISFSTEPLPGDGRSSDPSGSPTSPESGSRGSKPGPESEDSDESAEWKGKLKDGKPYSHWQDLPPLQAEPGTTALAGQVLDLRGEPLANVTLEIEGEYGAASVSAQTDDTGRFLIKNIDPGQRELIIDGRLAERRVNSRGSGRGPKEDHGVFEYGLKIQEGQTNILPFTIWLTKIDKRHAVKFPSPTTSEVIVTTPRIPGLELRIPANTTIQDHEGRTVREVSLTQIPLDRTPFPLPRNVEVPIYFTAQPGGAYIYTAGNIGARIHYPNLTKRLPGTRFEFWHYDPGYKGWYRYGLGTVPEDGKQVIPDPGISIYEFTGAMVNNPNAPANGPKPPCKDKDPEKCKPGDPVDATTGLFVLSKTDLFLPDGILPIELTRTYRPGDTYSRAFGIGTSHNFDMFFVGDKDPWTYIDLILPDGGRIHYDRISPGTSWTDAVYEHVGTPTKFYKSKISWNMNGWWDLRLKDGTLYKFPESSTATRPGQAALVLITTRSGASLTITRDAQGNITKISSPGGRWLEFTNVNDRITQAKDSLGRTVSYEYDGTGRLIRVTDPNGGITEYTYDASSRMLTVKDARGIVFLTNEYDGTGKVTKQTMVDGGTYLFSYTMNGSDVTQTDVTDPRGKITRRTFNAAGQLQSYIAALGAAEEQVTSYTVQSGTNFVLSKVDPLSRTAAYTYDTMGNLTSVTRLSGTIDAVTTTFTYEPTFNQLASITDPLNHTTTFAYDSEGNLISVTNALNQTTTIARNSAGQPISVTNPLNNTIQLTYEFEDLGSIADPLGNVTNRLTDAGGRVVNVTNPLGNATIYDYDVLNRLTQVVDPLNGNTGFTYDPNGNLLTVTDARNNTTTYTYENMDRLATRQDPLLRIESYQYDLAGNLTQFTDRKNQVRTFSYDGLNRRTLVTYADTSTTAYTYDGGNRVTQVVDSIAGTITRTYDGLNRLTSETTPQGSVSYTYDAASRRTSMTVAGQTTINYTYNNANHLIQITQGSSIVSFTYDAACRRTSVTLPNGILIEYIYDSASRVTEINYKQGITLIGNLTYEYDKNGSRTKIGGSFARTGVPQAIASTAYNAANHQTTFGDKTLTFDNNGNVQTIADSGGTTTYTWNTRNQLVGINGSGVSATFMYDGLGRREKKTINGNLTEFLFDDGLNPVQESSGATILANILAGLGIDEFLARVDTSTGATSYVLRDALGSSMALTDAAGTVQTEYTYEPFGKASIAGASNGSSYQYSGRENDGTGLYYYRARYYHPALQRFMSEDPLEFNGGNSNLYAYVGNQPTVLSDPLGLYHAPGHGGRGLPDTCSIPGACFPPPPSPPKSDPEPPIPPSPPPPPPTPTSGESPDFGADTAGLNDCFDETKFASCLRNFGPYIAGLGAVCIATRGAGGVAGFLGTCGIAGGLVLSCALFAAGACF